MDELLRYASLAGAGLPAHERHKAKTGTVRQLRRVQVESDGTLRFSAAHPCNEQEGLAKLTGLTFSTRPNDRGGKHVLLRAADAGDPPRADAAAAATPAPRKTRKLILLAY